jgi:hypothetical protein
MERISSSFTFFSKWVFPLAWFGFLGFFMYQSLRNGAAQSDPMFLAIPLVMAVFGVVLMRKLAWDLADSVDDCGSYLLVRKGRIEQRVDLANVMNVSASTFQNPPRITLRLVTPGELGREVSFSPRSRTSLNPFAPNPVAEDLMERVHRARSRAAL